MQTPSTTRRGALGVAALVGTAGLVVPPAPATPATSEDGWAMPFSSIVPLTSSFNGVAYALYVRTPVGYETGDRRYPVIVTLDADYSFPIAAMHLEHLAARMNQAPEAILVSIGVAGVYPDVRGYRRERTRDYTPVFHPDGGYGPEFQRGSGGGPAFLRMLTEEALPMVASRWRIDPDDRTLVGHSYGGLFTAWVLQAHPEAFSRYLMVSPSLWYADKLILEREAALSSTRLSRRTYAYLGVGSWEEQPHNGGYMVSEMTRFAEMLAARGDPNLIVKSRVFEDETHASIFPTCFSTGIRHLFGTMDG